MSRVTAPGSIRVEPLACSLGAELSNLNLGDAAHDARLFAEVHALLLQYKVLFLRDQHFSRAEHVAFARRFGALEDGAAFREVALDLVLGHVVDDVDQDLVGIGTDVGDVR